MHNCQETGVHSEVFYAPGLYFYCLYCGRKGVTLNEVLSRLEYLETTKGEQAASSEEVASLKAALATSVSENTDLTMGKLSLQQELESLRAKYADYPEDMKIFASDLNYFKIRTEQLSLTECKVWDAIGGMFKTTKPLWLVVDEIFQAHKQAEEALVAMEEKVAVMTRTAQIISEYAVSNPTTTFWQMFFSTKRAKGLYFEAYNKALRERIIAKVTSNERSN